MPSATVACEPQRSKLSVCVLDSPTGAAGTGLCGIDVVAVATDTLCPGALCASKLWPLPKRAKNQAQER